jgi:radical SAM superfamily enzyme YgiQ (UPF0313 family)
MNIEERSHTRSLGPYRIAHWLRENGWDAEVIDYCAHWSHEELTELCLSRITNETKFVGFSSLFTGWTQHIEFFSQFLQKFYPHIVQISGSSSLPNADMTCVDYHIYGFGEHAIDKLLQYLFSNGEEPKNIEYFNTKLIDASHYPAYPLNDYTVLYEDRDYLQPWEFLSIETGRGCKFKCSFCNFSVLGVKGDYSTSQDSFEKQMKINYDRWGIKNYVIAEETFNDRTEKVEKFSKVVKKLDFEPWFAAYIRADLLISRKSEMEYLADMNVFGQFYGVESFNQKTAKAIKKGMDRGKMKDGLLNVKEYFEKNHNKYRGNISLIVGAPYEEKESLDDSLDWLVNNWKSQSFTAYPLGIPVYGRQSILSGSYEQNEYEEVSIDELYQKHDKAYVDKVIKKNYIIQNGKIVEKKWLMWKNKQMDVVEAFQIHDKMYDVMKKEKFKKSTFAVAEFSGKKSTIEDKLKLDVNFVKKFRNEELQWVEEYKEKKLS